MLYVPCVIQNHIFSQGIVSGSTKIINQEKKKINKLLFLYRRMGIAQGWRSSLLECEAGGGTLLSLGREGVENAVAEAIGLSDFWTGRILNNSWILVPS